MALRLRTVDAFTDEASTGKSAAVVVLDETLPNEWMAALARVELSGDRVLVIGRAMTVLDGVLSSTATPARGS